MTGVEMEPIGWVGSSRAEPIDDDWDRVTATIRLDSDRFGSDALRGLNEFSHVEVVYLFDRVDPDRVQTAARRARGNPDWPEVGIFAQQTKARPNRIGVSVCRLVAVDELTVTVQGLDAIDKTPVPDIKPYISEFAARGGVRQPAWPHQLMADYWTTSPPANPPGHDALRRSYDAIADRYTAEIGDELTGKPLDRALLEAFGELCADGPVADLGAGPGHVGGYLASRDARVVSFDLSEVMCHHAQSDHRLPAAVADLACLPVAPASLAGVICFYALIHLDSVVVMDVRMPGMDGIEATRRIAAAKTTGGPRVLILTTFDLDEYVFEALRAGASGFALKSRPVDELLAAIRIAAAGEALLAPSVTRRLIAHFSERDRRPAERRADIERLTEREGEVLALIARGMSNTEIADNLHVSLPTVKTHVSRILAKLGARDRTQLVVFAYEGGFVTSNGQLLDAPNQIA
jgi:DNA-binding NarL/FixJ family response regulator/tRNA (Thr-GGU) A37 N-methylase